MAFGDLSADQRAYRDRVVARTRLRRDVVTAWIAAESGWGVTKASGNYLNIGPGRTYPSTAAAADAAASLINNSRHYGGIRASVGRSGTRQIEAIASSPWDAGRYGGDGSNLMRVYRQLAGMPDAPGSSENGADAPPATATPVGLPDWAVDRLRDAAGIPDGDQLLQIGLTITLVAAGLFLIVLGIVNINRRAGENVVRSAIGG